MQKDTAILLFCRHPHEEARHKKLAPKARNEAANQLLFQHSEQVALHTGLPVFSPTNLQQHGTGFGERLANAIETVFEAGYQKVVTIGSDSPGIKVSDLLSATKKLTTQDMVLGPAHDGGVYLLGICSGAYQRTAFVSLSWQNAVLQLDLQRYAEAFALKVQWLRPVSDIDNSLDLWDFYQSLNISDSLFWAMRSLWSITPSPTQYLVTNHWIFYTPSSGLGLRAPPLPY